MRVLVAEREILTALQLARGLEQAGHCVLGPARSSGEAIILARGSPPEFALIDVDLEHRGMGMRLARQVITEFRAPVVFIADVDALAVEHRSGAIDVIRKPFSASTFATILRHIREASGWREKGGMSAPICTQASERTPSASIQ